MTFLSRKALKSLLTVAVLVAAAGGGVWWFATQQKQPADLKLTALEDNHHEDEVSLSPDAIKELGIKLGESRQDGVADEITFTGTVEANQYQVQSITPLVSGRAEKVYVALGDRVKKGETVATLASPEAAELHGKLHEAETREQLAEKELERVKKAENLAAVLKAKAVLEKAEADLERLKLLEKAGVAAKKDLVAAKSNYEQAKAEYEFQGDIALNREIARARAELETSRAELSHIESGLRTIGGELSGHGHKPHDTSLVVLRSPIGGTLIERFVNAGMGVEAGKPMFTIADLSTVWIIANVPESQIAPLSVGLPARVKAAGLGPGSITGRISYIDPTLDKETRTAKVRIEADNPGYRLKVDMFVEVTVSIPGSSAEDLSIWVPDSAIEKINGRDAVFVPAPNEPGVFQPKYVKVGKSQEGQVEILDGLSSGEQIVVEGGFKLKSILLKEELGEGHGH